MSSQWQTNPVILLQEKTCRWAAFVLKISSQKNQSYNAISIKFDLAKEFSDPTQKLMISGIMQFTVDLSIHFLVNYFPVDFERLSQSPSNCVSSVSPDRVTVNTHNGHLCRTDNCCWS